MNLFNKELIDAINEALDKAAEQSEKAKQNDYASLIAGIVFIILAYIVCWVILS